MPSLRNHQLIKACKLYALTHPGQRSLSHIVANVLANTPAPYDVDYDHAVVTCNRLHAHYSSTPDARIPRPTLRRAMWVEIYTRARALTHQQPSLTLSKAVERIIAKSSPRFYLSQSMAMRIVAPHAKSILFPKNH